jgi:hypothetical protein
MSSRTRKFAHSHRVETPMLQGTALALPGAMSKGLKKKIRERAEKSDFANQLLGIATRIERDFDGQERERLLDLVHETLDRHVEIREMTRRAREALEQLQSDQRTLLRLFDFITARPERETIH